MTEKGSRRVLAAAMAALLSLSLLAGCRQGGPTAANTSGQETSTSGQSGTEGNSAESVAGEAAAGQAAGTEQTAGAESGTGEAAGQTSGAEQTAGTEAASGGPTQMDLLNPALPETLFSDSYGTAYEIFVYSFADSDGDGIGDINGVRSRLSYIKSLGCTAIWLTPVFPSPTYHKYDATDYYSIDPAFGSLEDFDALLREAHDMGIRVIMDLALNHSAVRHPYFERACEYLLSLSDDQEPREEDCPYVWFYHFLEQPADGYAPLTEAGVEDLAPEGHEDRLKRWYYEARFWSGMPDFNLDTPLVRDEVTDILGWWLGRGVDGFRLDAVTSYYTGDASSNVDFLSFVTEEARRIREDVYLVGEAWADRSQYEQYYASGIDSLFDFSFAGQEGIIAQVVKGTRSASTFSEEMEKEEAAYASYNPSYINAPFYTNHDMARSAGYYAYDDGSRTKLAQGLNLLMPGRAFIYYGEEIGMKGSGKDENKRAPMFWSEDGGDGTTSGPPDMDKVTQKFASVAGQEEDPYSILHYVRHAAALRETFPAISRGRTTNLTDLSGEHIAAFTRWCDNDAYPPVLVVINTGEEAQTVSLSDHMEYTSLSAVLTVSGEQVTWSGDTRELVLPPFGIAVMTL